MLPELLLFCPLLDLFEVLCFFGHPFALELVDRCPSSSSDLNPFVLLFFDPLEPSDSRAQRVRAEALHARHDSAHPVSRPAARRAARRAGLARHVASLATRAAPFVGAESRAFATDFFHLFDLLGFLSFACPAVIAVGVGSSSALDCVPCCRICCLRFAPLTAALLH